MMQKRGVAKFSPGGADGLHNPSDLGLGRRAFDGERRAAAAAPEPRGPWAVWDNVRAALRAKLGDSRFDLWIARLDFVAEVDGDILIAAPDELDRDRVRGNFGHILQDAWSREDGRRRRVVIEARTRISPDVLALAARAAVAEAGAPTAAAAVAEPACEGPRDVSRDGAQTLDNFLVGDSNRIAFGLARRLAMGASVAAQVVMFVGPHGVGKTHLLRGVEARLRASGGEGSVVYMSAEDFMLAFVDGVKRKDTSDLRATMRRARVVLLDDFQFICSKPGTLSEFFSHLRALVANGGVVALSCDQPLSSIDQLDGRMRDEIQGGVVARMDLPERSLRREIVRAKADEIRASDPAFDFAEEWVELLADRLPASGRALCGAVRNVYVGTLLANQPLTRAAVDKAVQLQLGGAAARPPRIDTIKDVTARQYGVTKADLESVCRKRTFAQPRQYSMYLCRKLTNCSYPQIGRMFGDRDHTTVLFAFRKIERLVAQDAKLADELRQLEQRILADPRNGR